MLASTRTRPEARPGCRVSGLLGGGSRGQAGRGDARPGWRSPAAITFGVIDEKVLNIGYTGVDPAFHGRGLAVVVQHGAHAAAARLGVERSVTENDEQIGPSGVRRLRWATRSGSASTQWPPTWRRLQHCRPESCRAMAALTGGRGASFRPNAGPSSKGERPAEVITPMT